MDDPACSRPNATLPALIAGFAAIYLVWGSTYLGIKFAVESLPPYLLGAGRFLLSGAIVYAFLRLRGVAAPTAQQWRLAAWTSILLLPCSNGLVSWGQQTVASGRAALIVATTPLWMVMLGWLFYDGKRPGWRVWVGLVVGFLGAGMLLARPGEHDKPGAIWGMVSIALATVAWSLGSLESRRLRPTADPMLTSALQMLTGGVMMLILGLCLGEAQTIQEREITQSSIVAFFYLVVAGGLIGFPVYAWLLRVASPTAVSTYAYVNPLVAVFLGWLVVGEVLHQEAIFGAVLIIGSVVLITLPG